MIPPRNSLVSSCKGHVYSNAYTQLPIENHCCKNAGAQYLFKVAAFESSTLVKEELKSQEKQSLFHKRKEKSIVWESSERAQTPRSLIPCFHCISSLQFLYVPTIPNLKAPFYIFSSYIPLMSSARKE